MGKSAQENYALVQNNGDQYGIDNPLLKLTKTDFNEIFAFSARQVNLVGNSRANKTQTFEHPNPDRLAASINRKDPPGCG